MNGEHTSMEDVHESAWQRVRELLRLKDEEIVEYKEIVSMLRWRMKERNHGKHMDRAGNATTGTRLRPKAKAAGISVAN
jgi:hypothetical protein